MLFKCNNSLTWSHVYIENLKVCIFKHISYILCLLYLPTTSIPAWFSRRFTPAVTSRICWSLIDFTGKYCNGMQYGFFRRYSSEARTTRMCDAAVRFLLKRLRRYSRYWCAKAPSRTELSPDVWLMRVCSCCSKQTACWCRTLKSAMSQAASIRRWLGWDGFTFCPARKGIQFGNGHLWSNRVQWDLTIKDTHKGELKLHVTILPRLISYNFMLQK